MRYFICLIAAFFVVSLIQINSHQISIGASSAFAVKPPSDESRQKAAQEKTKDNKQKAKEQRESGCQYGKDKVTGKCYEPKSGQFYRDPKTGEVEVKRVDCWNLPWKACKAKEKSSRPSQSQPKKSSK